MMTFTQIIEDLGGTTQFSRLVGVGESHARTMKARDSVPVTYWPALLEALRNEGKPTTLEALVSIQARKERKATKRGAAA